MLEFDDDAQGPGRPVIKVIGVGGGGGNALNTMIEAGIEGVDFIVANTDGQVLEANLAATKVHLGRNLTKGLGAGANPEIGRAAALEDASRVAEALSRRRHGLRDRRHGRRHRHRRGARHRADRARCGALTVGVVTKPFAFEGSQRKKKAGSGISELGKAVDTLIVIPNDRLLSLAGMKMTLKDAFAKVDNVCLNAVRGISDLVIAPGLINVDFADVRTIMTGMGRALMGTGIGTGDKRAIEAAQQAISSPLLEDVSINGATGILINITGGPDLTLAEMNEACSLIAEAADPDANIIFGSVIDANAGDEVRITVIATGFQSHVQEHPTPSAGRGHARSREGQMALPMQSAAAQAATVPAMATAPWPAATTPDEPRRLRGPQRDDQHRRLLPEHGADPARAAAAPERRGVDAGRTSRSSARRARGRRRCSAACRDRSRRSAHPTSWVSRSRSSTSRPTSVAASTPPSSNRNQRREDAPR